MNKLFKDMTADEQLRYVTDLSTFAKDKLPLLEQFGDAWEACHVKSMREGLALLNAFQFARDFVEKSLRYGDYSARVKRLRFYVDLIQKKIQAGEGVYKGSDGATYAIVPPLAPQQKRRGRPASAETIARREAAAKAAVLPQQALFGGSAGAEGAAAKPQLTEKAGTAAKNDGTAVGNDGTAAVKDDGMTVEKAGATVAQPFISPMGRDDTEYKLSIAQKRAFLSSDLQKLADQIRALRHTYGAASEKAKTMAELKASPDLIAPVASEAQRTLEKVNQIYGAIDEEMAVVWYRLQNDSDEWRAAWMKRFGFKSMDDLHPDLKSDLRHHYKKVTEEQPDFDDRMRRVIEQESPEYIERQKQEAAKKKEVQDILRYLKRKDKGVSEQRVKTSREKYARLVELLGKKEAADYKPLLTKIEDDYKAQVKAAKETTTD